MAHVVIYDDKMQLKCPQKIVWNHDTYIPVQYTRVKNYLCPQSRVEDDAQEKGAMAECPL